MPLRVFGNGDLAALGQSMHRAFSAGEARRILRRLEFH
jgi:hypothetical protein